MTKKTKPARKRKLSPAKRITFTLIALLLPIALVIILELVLRLVGHGGYPPTFKQLARFDNGDALISTNAESSQAYFFRNRDLPGTLSEMPLISPKPADTYRVFFVGGSAIKGYPQFQNFATPAFFEAMLEDIWPDRDVEVINLGTTAVASFPALQMLTEALDYQPDLIVIYSGHNEYFGAYGVASLNTIGRSAGMIAFQHELRRFAIIQWVDSVLSGSGTTNRPAGTMLMELMMDRPFIGPEDPLRDAAEDNLQSHISTMVERCNAARVPAIVCTLPANERGLAPLGTSSLDGLTPNQTETIQTLLERAQQSIETDPDTIINPLEEALAHAPDHARLHWYLASALHEAGRFEKASKHFQIALDLDPMPWRATSGTNDAVRAAAQDAGATLCDVVEVFRETGEGGSIGWDLMDDHVHMSLRGQALVAEALIETMTTMLGSAHIDPARLNALRDWSEYAEDFGDNIYERYAVAYRMRNLFNVPFYLDTNPEAVAYMDALLAEYESHMPEQYRLPARVWQDPAVNFEFSRPLSSLVGINALQQNDFDLAAKLFYTTYRILPRYSEQGIEYAYRYTRTLQRANGELPPEARQTAIDAIEHAKLMIANSESPEYTLSRHIGSLYKVLGDHESSIPYLIAARPGFAEEGLVELDQTLIHSFIQIGELDQAIELTRSGMRSAGRFASIYQGLHAKLIAQRDGLPLPESSPTSSPPTNGQEPPARIP